MLNWRSRAVEGWCAWTISLSSPMSTEFKMWKLPTRLSFSSFKIWAQLSHVLGDRSSRFPHHWGFGRRRECSQLLLLPLFCLDKIIKHSQKRLRCLGVIPAGCVKFGHISVGWAPLLGAVPLCTEYRDRNSALFKGQIYHLLKHFQRVGLATYWGSHPPSRGRECRS